MDRPPAHAGAGQRAAGAAPGHDRRQPAQSGEPAGALTGPVARGDVGTVRAHLRLLARRAPRFADAYRALSLRALTLAAPRLDDEQVRALRALLSSSQEARP